MSTLDTAEQIVADTFILSADNFGAYTVSLVIMAAMMAFIVWLFKQERTDHLNTRDKLTDVQNTRISESKEHGKDLLEVTQLLVPIVELIKSNKADLQGLKEEILRGRNNV
jgi:uncharacterized protein HemX